ncbi:MAG: hypothetical protein QOF82_2695 [Frankiales bacterium]|nr:hypothetical protein [Frankiales bacterium]
MVPWCETGMRPGHDGPFFVDDVVCVRAELVATDRPVTVVAHSYGGIAGDGPPPPWIDIDLAAATFALRPEFAAGTYLQDCPDDVVGPAVERLVPQAVSVSAAPVTFAAWQGIPSTYLVCAGDLGTPPALQRQQAERAARVAQSRGSLDSKWCPPTRLGPSFGGVAPREGEMSFIDGTPVARSPSRAPSRPRRAPPARSVRLAAIGIWRPSASRPATTWSPTAARG